MIGASPFTRNTNNDKLKWLSAEAKTMGVAIAIYLSASIYKPSKTDKNLQKRIKSLRITAKTILKNGFIL